MLVCLLLCLTFLLGQAGGQRCCQRKTVASGAKAGTYNLVTASDAVPDFCLGGCVYTKESDTVPGNNYCFQAGQGEVSCSGGGCGGGGDVEGWIEKYFEKQCSTQFNSVLNVWLYKAWQGRQCGPSQYNPITNITLEVFDNPGCEGKPLQEKLTEGNQETFLIRVEHTNSWSVQAISEKYETKCQNIGNMMPFTSNYETLYLREEVEEKSKIVRTASLNFSYDVSKDLRSKVRIQSTPFSCSNSSFGKVQSSLKVKSSKSGRRNKKKKNNIKTKKKKNNMKNNNIKSKGEKSKGTKKKRNSSDYDFFEENPAPARRKRQYGGSGCGGSGWGSGGSGSGGWGPGGCNWKCRPTCPYNVWQTEPSLFSCQCRGVLGAGLNSTLSGQTGRYDWYDNPAIPHYYYSTKYFLVFAEFTRRGDPDLPVCDSKLSITYNSPNNTQQITKDVPCFTKPVPPPTMLPTFPPGGGSGNLATPGISFSPPGSDSATASPSRLSSGSSFSSGLGSGSSLPWPSSYPHYLTAVNHHDMFTETEGVLIWGGSDRFWIVGCLEESSKDKFVTFDVEFFTSKEPFATPEFCGCILRTVQGEETMASKDLVKDCYVNAINGGAAPRTGRTAKRSKTTRKQRKRISRKKFRRMKKQNKKNNFGQHPKKSLKDMIKNMKQKDMHFIGRSKRDVSDEKFGRELFDEEDFMEEEDFLEEEDISNDQDYEEKFSYEMMSDDNDYDYYDDDYNMSSDWN